MFQKVSWELDIKEGRKNSVLYDFFNSEKWEEDNSLDEIIEFMQGKVFFGSFNF